MRHTTCRSLAATALIVLSLSCHDRSRTRQSPAPLLEVEVATARLDSLGRECTFIGDLYAKHSVVIQPRINGYLISAPYTAGMPVRRGERIFEIDPRQISTSLASAEAQLSAARARLASARSNYERAVPLARIEAISRSQLDEYSTAYASAQAAVLSAEQSVENYRIDVGYTVITAPISGIIAADKANVGDYVGPGTEFEQLTVIDDTDTMSVKISLPTSLYLQYRRPGQASFDNSGLLSDIRLSLSDGRLYPYEGIYDHTAQSISSSSGTVDLAVDFPNPDAELKAGEFARITLRIGGRRPVVTVPQQAVSQLQGVNSVWVVNDDSTAEYRRVELGGKYGGDWVVVSGVNAGERVVVSGGMKLRESERVKIKNE